MRTAIRGLAAGVTAMALLTGCGGPSAKDLQNYLGSTHKYDEGYADLVNSPMTVKDDGSVAVTLPDSWWTKYEEAADLCNWISGWVYDQGNGGANSSITLKSHGDIVSQRRAEQDVCNPGDPSLG